jgi:hypothetical protein
MCKNYQSGAAHPRQAMNPATPRRHATRIVVPALVFIEQKGQPPVQGFIFCVDSLPNQIKCWQLHLNANCCSPYFISGIAYPTLSADLKFIFTEPYIGTYGFLICLTYRLFRWALADRHEGEPVKNNPESLHIHGLDLMQALTVSLTQRKYGTSRSDSGYN